MSRADEDRAAVIKRFGELVEIRHEIAMLHQPPVPFGAYCAECDKPYPCPTVLLTRKGDRL